MLVGAFEEAIVEFDAAIRANPEKDIAYYNRGQAYFKLGRFDAAKNDYDEAFSLSPESSLFHVKRGDAHLAMGQHDRAVQDHNQAISLDPEFALAFYSRGGAYVELGRRDEAIQDYEQAVSLDHRLGITNNVSSRCAFYDELYPKDVAYQDCRGLASHASRFSMAYTERGLERFAHGEYRGAIRDYDLAIRLDSSSDLYKNRALAYQNSGQIDEAFRDFQTALGKFGFAPAYYHRGNLLYELGEYQVAAKDHSQAISMDPLYLEAYVGRALAYTQMGKDKDAKLDVERAEELGADRAELERAIRALKNLR